MNKEPTKRLASAIEMAFLLRSPLENTDAELAQDLLDGGPIIFEPALVGRDAELKTLDNLCKNTLKGKGRIIWLNGPEKRWEVTTFRTGPCYWSQSKLRCVCELL